MSPDRICYHCGCTNGPGKRELRPYGPGGADVCAGCVFDGPPERKKEAERQFASKLEEASRLGEGTALIDGNGPPVPYPTRKRGKA